jgi:putative ABC transport system ATP-binding protein
VSLVVRKLRKTYGNGRDAVHAVKDVGFSMRRGDFVALVGPSGSGKTTLLAMIGGLLTPSAGEILVDGRDIARLSRSRQAAYRRSTVGYVFQSNNLLPYLTARENLLVVADIGGLKRREATARADQLLRDLGLGHRARALATELSGGERQRVAIGRALMNHPRLVLVDEPTAALDSERGRKVVETLVAEVKGRDVMGIMVTHDLAMAAEADRILTLHDGSLEEIPHVPSRLGSFLDQGDDEAGVHRLDGEGAD